MDIDIVLRVPFDVLDAATVECLPGFGNGIVSFERETITPVSSLYRLQNHQLGDIGTIALRKLSADYTEIAIRKPRKVRANLAATEHKQRAAHQELVISAFFARLADDSIAEIYPELGLGVEYLLLHTKIADHFSQDELEILCPSLGLKFDDLPGDTRQSKSLELVMACKRSKQMDSLIEVLQEARPEIDWQVSQDLSSKGN